MTENQEPQQLGLFEGFGIELEYMIVDRETLAIAHGAPSLLRRAAGAEAGDLVGDVERGPVAWSNELVDHVVELKCNGPAATLEGLAAHFQDNLSEVQELLAAEGQCLMPGAMHPWMDPQSESKLWPGEFNEVYRAFDRIFDCSGHGWSNLQSTHINLPFADDAEFGRLHAAVRAVLPLVPSLAASSPVSEGRARGVLDHRMRVYQGNARRVPLVSGAVIPEPVWTRAAYEGELLESVYKALAPHDPEGILRHEWVNARGAIARFDRGAIEIRIMDIQECPRMDLAICALLCAVVQALTEERWCSESDLRCLETQQLASTLWEAADHGEGAQFDYAPWLAALGRVGGSTGARDLLGGLYGELQGSIPAEFHTDLEALLESGTLATRILARLEREDLRATYGALCESLKTGVPFRGRG